MLAPRSAPKDSETSVVGDAFSSFSANEGVVYTTEEELNLGWTSVDPKLETLQSHGFFGSQQVASFKRGEELTQKEIQAPNLEIAKAFAGAAKILAQPCSPALGVYESLCRVASSGDITWRTEYLARRVMLQRTHGLGPHLWLWFCVQGAREHLKSPQGFALVQAFTARWFEALAQEFSDNSRR